MILMGSFQTSAFCDSVKSSSCSPAGWCLGLRAGAALLLQGMMAALGSAQAGPPCGGPTTRVLPQRLHKSSSPWMQTAGSGHGAGDGGAPFPAAGRWLSTRTMPSLGTHSLTAHPGVISYSNGCSSREEVACDVPAPAFTKRKPTVTG